MVLFLYLCIMKKYICKNCNNEFESKKGCKSRTPLFCSKKCSAMYNVALPEVKEKMSIAKIGKQAWNKGVKMWEGKEHPRGTKGMKFPNKSGENSIWWKGGITSLNESIRKSSEYKEWRKSVFERDKYTCQHCNKKGCKIHADHIKPFSIFKDLRFDINNGRTLCVECHYKTETYGGKMLKYENSKKEQ
jgi:glutamate synthase domain-containing protein 2